MCTSINIPACNSTVINAIKSLAAQLHITVESLTISKSACTGCLTVPGLSELIPLIAPLMIKVAFVALLGICLHIFYKLIPEEI